ncbi:MAG TPA: 3-hydroxyacyl-CoA dehydrogenase NAD-binding domain-containing protein, partial [Actinotalea sp.]|nr:3-hydroxyacyl-CoA dehydrogenase NAD-binding domain-containing protein [Actinotalea sp.]
VLAQAGHTVHCTDAAEGVVGKARTRVTAGRYGFERAVERGKLARADADAALARLRFSTDFESAVGAAELVLEAVPSSTPPGT